jgi:hypothetical protein
MLIHCNRLTKKDPNYQLTNMQNEIYKGRSVQTSDREHMSFDQASSHRQYQQTPTSHS